MKPASALGFLLAAGVAGLTFGSAAHAQQTVKIGSVLSVTGPASFLGEPEDKTLRMYVEKINAAGGINGKKVELIIYDDGGDANKARTFATRLIEDDKVVAMAGGSTTGTTMAMIPVFEEAQVPFISFGGAVEIIISLRTKLGKGRRTNRRTVVALSRGPRIVEGGTAAYRARAPRSYCPFAAAVGILGRRGRAHVWRDCQVSARSASRNARP